MRGVFRALALLIPVLVAVQAAAVAVNAFGMFQWVDEGQSITKSVLEGDWEWTGAWGAMSWKASDHASSKTFRQGISPRRMRAKMLVSS